MSKLLKPKLPSFAALPTAPARPLPWYKRFRRRNQQSNLPPIPISPPREVTKWSFGQPISEVSLSDGVPYVLTALRSAMWKRQGQLSEGIFRVSPAASDLKAHRAMVEAGRFDELHDVDCIAQLIKLWFKELPESVFAPQFSKIVDSEVQRDEQCAQIVLCLPEVHQSTVIWLLQLFTDICRHETQNRMTAQSLTIVFSPNLLDPPSDVNPIFALELNKRMVRFLERLFDYWNHHGSLMAVHMPAKSEQKV